MAAMALRLGVWTCAGGPTLDEVTTMIIMIITKLISIIIIIIIISIIIISVIVIVMIIGRLNRNTLIISTT